MVAFVLPCSHRASQRTFSTRMIGKEQYQFQFQAVNSMHKNFSSRNSIDHNGVTFKRLIMNLLNIYIYIYIYI